MLNIQFHYTELAASKPDNLAGLAAWLPPIPLHDVTIEIELQFLAAGAELTAKVPKIELSRKFYLQPLRTSIASIWLDELNSWVRRACGASIVKQVMPCNLQDQDQKNE